MKRMHEAPVDAFELHSPTVTSTKFWPGSLGRTGNTAMVIARLLTPSSSSASPSSSSPSSATSSVPGAAYDDHGVHNFIVPLRDPATHAALPGVELGDIGPKIGFNNMDNGFLRLHRVRVPRANMAARFSFVDERGRYHRRTGTSSTSSSTSSTSTSTSTSSSDSSSSSPSPAR